MSYTEEIWSMLFSTYVLLIKYNELTGTFTASCSTSITVLVTLKEALASTVPSYPARWVFTLFQWRPHGAVSCACCGASLCNHLSSLQVYISQILVASALGAVVEAVGSVRVIPMVASGGSLLGFFTACFLVIYPTPNNQWENQLLFAVISTCFLADTTLNRDLQPAAG